jgi:alkylation response protein AidB-like acyl-CoA dehydrogenase
MLGVEKELKQIPQFSEVDADTINQILEEGGKFAADVIFPLNPIGDHEGCTFDVATHSVKTPSGFKAAFDQYREAGWPTLVGAPEYGGQGLPVLVNNALFEMIAGANQAWVMYPGLTMGAWECLLTHGTEEQKATYLPKMISCEWAGTMCLTEAHCGTDLGLLRTKAEPQGDGTYKLTGSKIFISSGEHDLTDNIIHLVLARLPDAPAGSKGISLFVVPKFLVNADGSLGARNPITCGAIEHKMGIHGNSTCQMNLDGAIGTMVSEPGRGLNAMFVMMNGARLGVGIMGLGLTEVAYQNSLAYAKDRLQGRALKGPAAPDKPADPIIVHPDVRRMLLTQKAYAEGARAFAYWVGLQFDKSTAHPDQEVRAECNDLVALLTPIVKAFITDNSSEAANLGMQIYGGHGYITESGMEQYVRDARINQIYEGTNGIQSLDLLGRKVLMDNGAKLRKFGSIVKQFIEDEGTSKAMDEFITPLADIATKVEKLSMEVGMKAFGNKDEAGAAATDYLRVVGHMVFSYFWARMAKLALQKEKENSSDPFYAAKLHTARFYFERLLPETAMLIRRARSGSKNLMAMPEELF